MDSSSSDADDLTSEVSSDDPAEGAQDPDQDIRDLIRAGNVDAALRLLMKRHGNAVYRYCCEGLRDATLSEDVHQRIFTEAYRDCRRFAGRSTVRAWLFGIARHRVLDAAKLRRRHQGPLEQGDLHDVPDLRPGADERIDDARLIEALRRCLQRLDEHIRAAVLLRFQQGLTFEEMAEACGQKPGTLQARVTRALPVLRDCIESESGARV